MFGIKRYWRTPGGPVPTTFRAMTEQPHLLIAGATGSGKSVLENGLINTLLHQSPARVGLILIDPKRVELSEYKRLPHVLRYAADQTAMIDAIRQALDMTEDRYRYMARHRLREFDGQHVYVVIDELAALMTANKKAVLPTLQQLGQIARAARVHMIACTQTVKADVLPTVLTCNFDARVALRTSTAQQSRMIVDCSGCEKFPSPRTAGYALAYYRHGADLDLIHIPRVSDGEQSAMVAYWTSRDCIVSA